MYRRASAVGGFLVPACYARFPLECSRAVSLFILVITCYSLLGAFYASAPKVPEALCFRVVRPSGSPSGFFRLRDNSSIT